MEYCLAFNGLFSEFVSFSTRTKESIFSLKPLNCNHPSNQSVPRFSINVTGLASLKRKRGLEAELVNHNIQDSFLLHEESSNRKQSKKVEHLFEIIISLVIRNVFKVIVQ